MNVVAKAFFDGEYYEVGRIKDAAKVNKEAMDHIASLVPLLEKTLYAYVEIPAKVELTISEEELLNRLNAEEKDGIKYTRVDELFDGVVLKKEKEKVDYYCVVYVKWK